MFFEPKDGHGLPHSPISACVVPRPIGWISTLDEDGTVNLAPFSYFNFVHNFPPTVMFACNGLKADGSPKDSWVNAERSGEFVYNMASFPLKEKMNLTSKSLPRNVDEMEHAGLESLPSRIVGPPRVAASPICLECKTIKVLHLPTDVEANPNSIVFGKVVGVHIDDTCLTEGLVDIDKTRPMARLGYLDYGVISQAFAMPRYYDKTE